MQVVRQFGTAIFTSLISVLLVIGGLSLALSENSGVRPPATNSFSGSDLTATSSALEPIGPTQSASLIPSPTTPPSSGSTFPPSVTPATLTITPTFSTTCGPPPGWVKSYVVQPGDNLFRIAQNYSTSTAALQHANCKGASTNISPGEVLWVPNVQPHTPGVTVVPTFPTSSPVPTDPLTETALPFTASPSATHTVVPATQTPLPTVTPVTPPL